jgi:sugar lactone lactonase YvrE
MNKKTIYTILLMCALILGSARGLAIAEDKDEIEIPQVEVGLPGTVFRYEQTFGENGVAYLADGDHIYNPDGVGLDGNGNLWVVEGAGARALKYTTEGTFLWSIGTAGLTYLADETHLVSPRDVTIDIAGNIWVTDMGSNRVVKFDPAGNYLTQLGITWEGGTDNAHFNGPVGAAFDSEGYVYISDFYNHRVQIFGSNGFYSTTLGVTGEAGSDNDHFNTPNHIFIDDSDYLYVVDERNHRVQIFDEEHNYFATLGVSGEEGWDNDHFSYPRGVAVDSDYIYVSEGNHRVQLFNRTTLVYQDTLGYGGGSGDYQFDWPTDVAVDSDGYIYVADVLNTRVQKFEYDGVDFTLVHTFGETDVPYLTDGYHYNQPFDVAVDDAGNIAIVEDWGRGHRLIVLDASGEPLFDPIGEPGVAGVDNQHFADPKGVAFDNQGRVYVADCGNNRVQIFNSAGIWVALIGTGWGEGDYQFKCPSGVAIDNSGYIYVADADNHRIQIFDNTRAYVDTLGVTGVPGTDNEHFKWPQDVEVDADGNIYTAEWANHRVQKFNSDLEWQMTLGMTGECGYDFDHFCEPYGVAVDADGIIYVAEKFGHRVQVFDASGAYLTTIVGANSDQTGGLRETYGLDVDSAGNVYIADLFNHRVQKFAPGVPGWEQINVNGFGVRANRGLAALEVFEGSLYAGTGNWEQGGRVWRTADGVTWEPTSSTGFGMGTTNSAIIDLIEFEGRLYAGTGWGGSSGQVWRSLDGTTWEAVTTNGFGDGGNSAIDTFVVFNGKLYAGTGNSNGAQIWRSKSGDGNDWVQVAPDGDVGQGDSGVTAFAVFEGALYSAIEDDDIAQIWRSTDGSEWEAVVADGYENEENRLSGGFAEFGGYLYVGSGNEVDGAELWRSDDGTQWELAKGEGFGDPSNIKVQMVFVFDGWLYVGLDNPYIGMQVWRTDDGTEWEQVNLDGFGDSNNTFTLWSNGTTIFECRLTLGIWNEANGGEVWSMLNDGNLCIDKSGPDSAYFSEQVTYQMAVTFSSLDGSAAQKLSVVDDHYGTAAYVSGDTNEDDYLDINETWIFEVSGTIGAPGEVDEDPIVNIATVTGQDMQGIDLTPATDSHATYLIKTFLPFTIKQP